MYSYTNHESNANSYLANTSLLIDQMPENGLNFNVCP